MPLHSFELAEYSDEELVAQFNAGERGALEVLVDRYRRFARAKGRGYFLVGGDADDVEQEALIGLFKAVRDFRPDRESSFRAFAELCITRQIITAIKTATRQKHQPLNQYLSISASRPSDDAGDRSVGDTLECTVHRDPCEDVVTSERLERMHQSMQELLSGLEVDVLRLYVAGKTYQEIGVELGRHVKSIDNALQRIKRKLDVAMTRIKEEDDEVIDLTLTERIAV